MAEPLIELKDIYKIYHMGDEQVRANDGISLTINRGEFVAIVGKSGSGKSTLMNIIGALDVPTSGSYLLVGEDVDQMSDDQLADIRNRMIGFIFQQYNLLPKSHLLENVELPLLYAKVPAEERRERAMRSLKRVGLAEKWKNMPNQLSGGQQQRVSIARALAGDPSLILADEPTGALDSKTSREVLNFLKELNEEGNTIVMITHDNAIALEAKHVVRIHDGKINFNGDVNAYMSYMTESFASLGTNQISVNMVNLPSRSVAVDEMYAFYEENTESFDHMTPMVSISATVKNGTDSMTSTSVNGISEDYLGIKDWTLAYGRNIQYADITARHKVCVIGAYVADELYGSAEKAYGETIKVNGYAFQIVGVVEQQDDTLEEGGTDDFLFMPYSCAVKMARNASINNYTFTIRDLSAATEGKNLIENFLYEKFKNEDLYTVTAMSEMLDSLNSMIAMVSAGLGGIAGISLLVAGVGVMNIMLVSVTERTREIGIRKALGAKRSVIMQQFVIEAAVTSSLGGVIGILLGSIATSTIGALAGLNATPTPMAVIVSFSVSVGIGLLFGYMPASRAAKLNPIDALRSE